MPVRRVPLIRKERRHSLKAWDRHSRPGKQTYVNMYVEFVPIKVRYKTLQYRGNVNALPENQCQKQEEGGFSEQAPKKVRI